MLEKYEYFMRELLKEKICKNVDLMSFEELYDLMEAEGFIKVYPNFELIRHIIKSDNMSDKSKDVTLKLLYLDVTTQKC